MLEYFKYKKNMGVMPYPAQPIGALDRHTAYFLVGTNS